MWKEEPLEKTAVVERDARGRFRPRKIEIKPTREWGYFFGLVIGDGSLVKTKSKNYVIHMRSTKMEIIKLFCQSAHRLGLNCLGPYIQKRTRRFPNGQVRTDVMYTVMVNSKVLYEALKQCKLEDYHFRVPDFVLRTREAIAGFLQGFFDAEGYVDDKGATPQIRAGSKHRSNLIQIKDLLDRLGIHSIISKCGRIWEIRIYRNDAKLKFYEKIGFRLKRKQDALVRILTMRRTGSQYKYSREVYYEAFRLREKGLSYSKIAEKLGVPENTVWRWIKHKRIPYTVRFPLPKQLVQENKVVGYGGEG